MVDKLKIIGVFTIVGFVLGVVINVMYFEVVPTLIAVFPQIFSATWVVWGLVGASISLVGCLVYASLPEK